ncbi:adenine-specific methyltransferase EcoRI family protein [Treponema sp. Marseille-Q4523]
MDIWTNSKNRMKDTMLRSSTDKDSISAFSSNTRCNGIMGVPISFLDKYCPEQFEIVGMCENEDLYKLKTKVYSTEECKDAYFRKFAKKGTYDLNASGVIVEADGHLEKVYQRLLIRHKQRTYQN